MLFTFFVYVLYIYFFTFFQMYTLFWWYIVKTVKTPREMIRICINIYITKERNIHWASFYYPIYRFAGGTPQSDQKNRWVQKFPLGLREKIWIGRSKGLKMLKCKSLHIFSLFYRKKGKFSWDHMNKKLQQSKSTHSFFVFYLFVFFF